MSVSSDRRRRPAAELNRWARNMSTHDQHQVGLVERVVSLLFVLMLPLLFILFLIVLLSWITCDAIFRVRFRLQYGLRGKCILFVYSDSPHWKQYIEANILPRIEHCSVILNWSQRETWYKKRPWEVSAFHHWAGDREFNPIAIVITPWGSVQRIRFWKAFRDFKHGKDAKLRKVEEQLFSAVEAYAPAAA